MFQIKDDQGQALVFAQENVDCIIVSEPGDWTDVVAVIRGREYTIAPEFSEQFVRDYMRGGPEADALDVIAENVNQLDDTLMNIDENLRGLTVAMESIERW